MGFHNTILNSVKNENLINKIESSTAKTTRPEEQFFKQKLPKRR